MSIPIAISSVSNLTSGGAVVYMKGFLNSVGGVCQFSPRKYYPKRNKILNLISYLRYIYFDLLIDYYKISIKINNDPEIKKVIIFQDSYTKSPYCLFFLKKPSTYILHEPPREFYEPSHLHAPTLSNKIFSYILRWPIKLIDYLAVQKATKIITNSYFSKEIVKKIYNRASTVIYPGISSTYLKMQRTKLKKENRCVSVGSLLQYKGHINTIMDISKIIQSKRPSLTIVGDGSKELIQEIINLSSSLEVKVEIISKISSRKLLQIYRKSKVYINNAINEPFGLAAAESLFCGCCLVTNSTGGTKELKKYFPENVLVSETDQSEMSKLILIGLNKKKSYVTKEYDVFSWDKVSQKIIQS